MPKRRRKDRHAAARLVQRTDCALSLHELRLRVHSGAYQSLLRQSVTRTVCRTQATDGTWVYMVINRRTKNLITVLTEEQVETLFMCRGRDPRELHLEPPDLSCCQIPGCLNVPDVVVRELGKFGCAVSQQALCDDCVPAWLEAHKERQYSLKRIERDE